jgi:hypothetical protein
MLSSDLKFGIAFGPSIDRLADILIATGIANALDRAIDCTG